mgnify:CR=1 FL=1
MSHEVVEKNVGLMAVLILLVISIAGLVEIVPLFYLKNTMEHNEHPEIIWQREAGQALADHQPGDGMRPYSALELAGRDIY